MINQEKLKLQEQAFEELEKVNFNGGIIMPTGSGKTYVMIKALKALPQDYNILYCCDNRKLRDEDFPNELHKWGASEAMNRMDRMCYQGAYKLKGYHYNIGLFDEGDYMLTPEYIKVLKNNTFDHIIFVSATLEGEKKKMIEKYIPIVFSKEVKDIEDDSIINKAQLHLVNFMLTKAENAKYLAYNEVFKKLINTANPDRQRMDAVIRNRKLFLSDLESAKNACQEIIKSLWKHKHNKILIFCSLSEQADAVCKYSYHSKNHKGNEFLNMFDKGELRILAVVGKIDRGINLEGVNCVIFESPGESKTKAIQKSGRARRLDVDEISHFYFLVPFYKNRMGNVKATIVQKWVLNSTKDFNQNFKYHNI